MNFVIRMGSWIFRYDTIWNQNDSRRNTYSAPPEYRPLRWSVSSTADITTWLRNYFGKCLWSPEIQRYHHKCHLKFWWVKRSLVLTFPRNDVDISGLGGSWNEKSHSGKGSDGSVVQILLVRKRCCVLWITGLSLLLSAASPLVASVYLYVCV